MSHIKSMTKIVAAGLCVHFAMVACEAASQSDSPTSPIPDAQAQGIPCARWEVKTDDDFRSTAVSNADDWEPFAAQISSDFQGVQGVAYSYRRCVSE